MIPNIERINALKLFPYFSKYPVIVDVGSNIGDWSDTLVRNVSQTHLFEPNIILLHYSMVRFCDAENVKYNNMILSNKLGSCEMDMYGLKNSGLSSIFNNPKWEGINKYQERVQSYKLDFYYVSGEMGHHEYIDFLKIDVEGAEMLVLEGAKTLLSEGKIKFIQVEKADHILLSGYTFDDLTKFLNGYGFVPMENEDEENVIFMQEGFTQDWNSEFIKNTNMVKANLALELGCFEGLTTRYICDNILKNQGRIICVDPLTDEYLPGHKDNHMFVGQYERFTRNTKGYPVELIRKRSIDAFDQLKDYRFDFIYIDGDHTEEAVYNDGVRSFEICKVGGIMLFDDYEGYDEGTTRGINRFLSEYSGKYEILKRGYQIMIKKNAN